MSIAPWLSSLIRSRRLPLRKAARTRTRLRLERLEDRVVMSTHTWIGAGADSNWSTPDNWTGGAPTVDEGTQHGSPVNLIFEESGKKTSIRVRSQKAVTRKGAAGYDIRPD